MGYTFSGSPVLSQSSGYTVGSPVATPITEANDGITRPTLFAPPPTGHAATDTSRLQALLAQCTENGGGLIDFVYPGTYEINKQLVYTSGTSLRGIPGCVKLRQAAGSNGRMLVAASRLDAGTTVTISWAANLIATITYPATHNLTNSDYLWVKGADNGIFNQVFRVLDAPTSTTVRVRLPRLPTASPGGTITAVTLTRDWSVEGLVLDYNVANNGHSTADDTKTAFVITGARFTVRDVHVINGHHRCFQAGAVADFTVDNISGDDASQVWKLYGPARDGRVSNVSGTCKGDDGADVQAKESDSFATYRWCFGDVLNITYENFDITSRSDSGSGVGNLVIYASDDEVIDGIVFRNMNGYHMQAGGITLKYGDLFSTGRIDGVTIEDSRHQSNSASSRRAIVVSCNVRHLRVINPRFNPDSLTQQFFRREAGTIDLLEVEGLRMDNTSWPSSSAVKLFDFSDNAGGVGVFTLRDSVIRANAANALLGQFAYATAVYGVVNLVNCDIEGMQGLFRFDASGATAVTCNLRGCRIKTMGYGIDVRTAMLVTALGCRFDTFTNGVVRTNAAVTAVFHDLGNTFVSAAQSTAPSGSVTVKTLP